MRDCLVVMAARARTSEADLRGRRDGDPFDPIGEMAAIVDENARFEPICRSIYAG